MLLCSTAAITALNTLRARLNITECEIASPAKARGERCQVLVKPCPLDHSLFSPHPGVVKCWIVLFTPSPWPLASVDSTL